MRVFDPAAAWVSACAGAASALSILKDWVAELFGVPLPVFLAAEAGAFGARVFIMPGPFWRALVVSQLWAIVGTSTAQLVLWIVGKWLEGTPPAGALAGIALLVAAGGQRIAPILWDRGGAALQRKLDAIGASKGGSV